MVKSQKKSSVDHGERRKILNKVLISLSDGSPECLVLVLEAGGWEETRNKKQSKKQKAKRVQQKKEKKEKTQSRKTENRTHSIFSSLHAQRYTQQTIKTAARLLCCLHLIIYICLARISQSKQEKNT